MIPPRASTVVIGQVVVAARPDGLETAEAVGLADGRVAVVGSRAEVLAAVRGAGGFDEHGDPVDPPVWLWRAAPDWTMARPKRPADAGSANCTDALIPPALSPKIVTRDGSPPNAEMWSRTHRSASAWSPSPRFALPAHSSPPIGSRCRNPSAPRR